MAASALALCCAPCAAQEAIATAKGGPAGDAPAPPPTEPVDIAPHLDGPDQILRSIGPCGGLPDPDTGKPDRRPHGEVHAGVGTHGYREAGGTVCIPLKDGVAATISVDAGRYPGWGPR